MYGVFCDECKNLIVGIATYNMGEYYRLTMRQDYGGVYCDTCKHRVEGKVELNGKQSRDN